MNETSRLFDVFFLCHQGREKEKEDHIITVTMPREAEPSLPEKTFLIQALDEGLRLDGRKFDQFRSLELNFGDEYGVAEVKSGKTR